MTDWMSINFTAEITLADKIAISLMHSVKSV